MAACVCRGSGFAGARTNRGKRGLFVLSLLRARALLSWSSMGDSGARAGKHGVCARLFALARREDLVCGASGEREREGEGGRRERSERGGRGGEQTTAGFCLRGRPRRMHAQSHNRKTRTHGSRFCQTHDAQPARRRQPKRARRTLLSRALSTARARSRSSTRARSTRHHHHPTTASARESLYTRARRKRQAGPVTGAPKAASSAAAASARASRSRSRTRARNTHPPSTHQQK